MTRRSIREWHCDRCGDEQAIEAGKRIDWHSLSGLYHPNPDGYFPGPALVPKTGGDLCPACTRAFLDWWTMKTKVSTS